MMPSLLITAYCTLGPCDAKCPYIPYYRIVIDGGLHHIVHLANTIRQKLEENEDTTNTPVILISWKAQLETWEKTATDDLWSNEAMEEHQEFEINFSKWWNKHDSSALLDLPSAVVQRHTLFLIFLQMSKAGIDIGKSPRTFFLTYSDHTFRQIQEHFSKHTPLSPELRPDDLYYVQVPMIDTSSPDYALIKKAVNSCEWLRKLEPPYEYHGLLPDFLSLAYEDDPTTKISNITTFLEEGSTCALASMQHRIRLHQALLSSKQGEP
jgi:hypothetical protein